MAKKKLFSREPLIWFHYVLLVGAMFGGFYLGEKYLVLSNQSTLWMFVFWFIVVSVSDQIIHYVLGVD
jgi:hypothetical protein